MTSEKFNYCVQKITQLLPVLLFICALYIVHRQLESHNVDDILRSLKDTPLFNIAGALLLTTINYIVLAAYDFLALRFTGHNQIPIKKMLAAALLSYAISNNTGHGWAAGGSIRYRFYSKWGVPGWDVLKISLFQTITYLLGALTLGLVGSLVLPHYLSSSIQEPQSIKWVSIICLLVLSIYWTAVFLWRKPLLIKGFSLYLPTPKMTLAQTIIAVIDVALSAIVLWVLLLGQVDVGFGAFLVVFVVAQVVGVISQVPGGIGIFESAFLWLMSGIEANDQHLMLISALLLYRIVYYFIPLLLAGGGLLGYEILSRKQQLIESTKAIQKLLSPIVPQVYSLLLLLAGSILLVSGSLPTNSEAMNWLADLIPLPVIELSHLSASLIGLLLLFLARGIRLRIDAAWYGSLLLLGLGIITALLKGFNWHEASALTVIWLLFLPTRHYFQRQSSLLNMPFSKASLMTIIMVLIGCGWLGFFAYRDVQYAHELWWQFSYEGDAPRFLRALLLIIIVSVCYSLSRLLSVAPPQLLKKPNEEELNQAKAIIMHSEQIDGFLALLGDKYLFWNAERDAFIMFAISGQFWIAMGDPIGNTQSFESLLWQFREQADYYAADSVFYQVSADYLPFYLDLGLSLFKLGEEANIDLTNFSLQGRRYKNLRGSHNKFMTMGYHSQIIKAVDVIVVLPQLQKISNNWLAHKNTKEKGFSLGFFNETYLARTDIIVIKDTQGDIKAFANIWQTTNREQLSVDLMRYEVSSPNGIMDFLFAELLLWGKAENYHWFSLGMAPLAGLEHHALSPLWHKIGALIFNMGDWFYNFEGLYDYKAKFAPHWSPRYLAVSAGLSVPFILLIITRLIAGGWKGVFSK